MTTGRRALAWAAAGAAAFVVYGSLVPFRFGPRTHGLDAVLRDGLWIGSRSDALANVLLGVPLGFALLGAACADRGGHPRTVALRGLLLLPACVLFSAAVECAQLYTPTRTCALSDVVAQGFGALAGMLLWAACGQRLTDRATAAWVRADVNAAGRLLGAYLGLLLFVQTLPFDLSASPADLYRKLRDGVVWRPFAEFAGPSDADRWRQYSKLARLAGLYFPVGLLLARVNGRPGRWGAGPVALACAALALALEAAQLLVQSRAPAATDALVGALTPVLGWYAARIHHEGLALPFVASWAVVWFALMTPVTMPPPGAPRLPEPRPFEWVTGAERGEPLTALEEVLTRAVLFGLLGVLVAARRLPPRTRRGRPGSVPTAVALAAVLGLAVAGLFESAQRWSDVHAPSVTDVLLGGAGAALGVLVAGRARNQNV
ncbi:MAG: VanZ family protein [Gemmata sp.]